MVMVEPTMTWRCIRGVRVIAAVVLLAVCVVPGATAKFRIGLRVSDRTASVGQPVTVVVRSELDLDYSRMIAVAPGKRLYDVVGRVTGDSSRAKVNIPHDGFWVPLERIAPNRWGGVVELSRAGPWRLVVPNGAPEGFMIPPPAMQPVLVHASASSAGARDACPVTIPTRTVPAGAGFSAAGFNYGNARIRAHLYWPHGTLTAGILPDGAAMAIINPDGSIDAKVGWWLATPERFVVTGRRLDARAPPLRARIPAYESYGLGFRPVGLTFPTVGCWRVVGKLGSSSLTFVVRVTKIGERAS